MNNLCKNKNLLFLKKKFFFKNENLNSILFKYLKYINNLFSFNRKFFKLKIF